MGYFDVDCEICKHYEDESYCCECEHNTDIVDHYEPMNEEEIKVKAEERTEKAMNEMVIERITIDSVNEKFLSDLNMAKKFVNRDFYRNILWSVVVKEDKLLATDTRRLVEIKSEFIPEELKDKCILDFKNNEFLIGPIKENNPLLSGASDKVMEVTGYKHVKGTNKEITSLFIPTVSKGEFGSKKYEVHKFTPPKQNPIFIQTKFFDEMMEVFKDSEWLEMYYLNEIEKILMTDGRIKFIQLPIRIQG